ncbi:hypothetical protein NMY22_g19547 [Coprinellus aureogranulatus]|nr:hypothetical protein NMY22_g19547 [Coprinellus aureogranulatus]
MRREASKFGLSRRLSPKGAVGSDNLLPGPVKQIYRQVLSMEEQLTHPSCRTTPRKAKCLKHHKKTVDVRCLPAQPGAEDGSERKEEFRSGQQRKSRAQPHDLDIPTVCVALLLRLPTHPMASLLDRISAPASAAGPVRSKANAGRRSSPYTRSQKLPKGDPDAAWSHDMFESHNSLSARISGPPSSAPKAKLNSIAAKALKEATGANKGDQLSIKGASAQGNVVEVKGLAPGTTAEDVAAIFKQCGAVVDQKLVEGGKNVRVRIHFKTAGAAKSAITKFHGQPADGKVLDVSIVGSSAAGQSLASRFGKDGLGLVRQEGSVDVLMETDDAPPSKLRSDALLGSDPRAQVLVAPPATTEPRARHSAGRSQHTPAHDGPASKRPPNNWERREIARTTIEAIDDGSFKLDGKTYDLRSATDALIEGTVYYPPDSKELEGWATGPAATTYNTDVSIVQCSTLEGCQQLHETLAGLGGEHDKRIGVLNFASAKKPGGGFLTGAQAQEETIARSSNLYASLMIDTAQRFYRLHDKGPKDGYYTHAMIYSPQVQLFRHDSGEWHPPIEVDVLTSPAVNAGDVRRKSRFSRRFYSDESDGDEGVEVQEEVTPDEVEARIEEVMKERMGRLLYLFEKRGVKNLVLGSFGTGVFRNSVETVARLWVELLVKEGSRFKGSFERVVFAIIDTPTVARFREVFSGRGEGGEETKARDVSRGEGKESFGGTVPLGEGKESDTVPREEGKKSDTVSRNEGRDEESAPPKAEKEVEDNVTREEGKEDEIVEEKKEGESGASLVSDGRDRSTGNVAEPKL